MKKIIFIIFLFTVSVCHGQLTNTSYYSWWGTNMGPFSGQTNIVTNFYKFVINPSLATTYEVLQLSAFPDIYASYVALSAVRGTIRSIDHNIYNVGSENENNGINLSVSQVTSGVVVGFTRVGIPISNVPPPILSGGSSFYRMNVTIPTNYPYSSISFSVTNTGAMHGSPFPYMYIINYTINVSSVRVDRATDGIHSTTRFDGSQPLGNLDVKIYIEKIAGKDPSRIKIYYDMNSRPDGSSPDGTVNKNRIADVVADGDYWVATIPVTDPEVQPGNVVYFIISIDGVIDDNNGQQWSYVIKKYAEQTEESETTISINNKFDPSFDLPYYIIYKLNRKSFVNISVYNIRGERVRLLKNEVENVGKFAVPWNGRNDSGKIVAIGLYLVYIHTAEFGDVRKVVVIKR